jgi:hypothetical protein
MSDTLAEAVLLVVGMGRSSCAFPLAALLFALKALMSGSIGGIQQYAAQVEQQPKRGRQRSKW